MSDDGYKRVKMIPPRLIPPTPRHESPVRIIGWSWSGEMPTVRLGADGVELIGGVFHPFEDKDDRR